MRPLEMLTRRVARVACVAAAAAVCLVGSPAEAQWGNMGRMMEPRVTSEDVTTLNELLAIPASSEPIVSDLFQSYMSKHEQARDTLREIFKKAQEEAEATKDFTVWQDVQLKAIEYIEYEEKLVDTFFDDVKLILTDEQLEQWPMFLRAHRRAHTLDTGQTVISGSNVDLVRLLEDEEVGADVSDLVERYATELDRLLIEREEMQERHLKLSAEIMGKGEGWMNQMDDWEVLFDEGRELEVKIRDVNQRYSRLMSTRLEGEERASFDLGYDRRAMPSVYEETYVDKAFEAVMGIEDLSDEQREQAEGIRSEYDREAGAIRAEWAEALAEWQASTGMMQMIGGQGGGGGAREHQKAKKDVDARFYERLRGILTETQVAMIPSREEPDWRTSRTFGD